MTGFFDVLRTGAWLTRERMRLVAAATLAAFAISAFILLLGAHGVNDSAGRPLGTDFSSFYAAGTLVKDGLAAQAYEQAAHFARERAIFGPDAHYYGFQYPPVFLLVAAGLAQLPYLPALALWQAATLILYLMAMRAIMALADSAGAPDRLWLLFALAFPAVFINLGHGQNGFLTVALFGGALALLDRRPIVAGILVGMMIYKPQFGLMIPLVLLATGRWRVIIAATSTVAALLLLTWAVLDNAVWPAFLASMTITRVVLLEQGDVGWFKIQSVFSWVRLWGGPVALAYALQGAVALGVAVGLVRLWRRRAPFALKASALLIGTILATPFSLDYDLMLLAPAIVFLILDGMRHGFHPWQKTLLAGLWFVPMVARSFTEFVAIPLATPVMLLAFEFVLRRAINSADGLQADGAVAATGVK
jgi:alpha-1,2-mannosyltransferase